MTGTPIGCEEAVRLLASYLDREASASDDERVQAHLRSCRSCYSRAEFERRLKQSLAELDDHAPTSDFQQRISRLLQDLERI